MKSAADVLEFGLAKDTDATEDVKNSTQSRMWNRVPKNHRNIFWLNLVETGLKSTDNQQGAVREHREILNHR